MNESLSDLIAVARGGRLAVALPGAMKFARAGAAVAARKFDDVVLPIVDRVFQDEAVGRHVGDALRFASVKVSYLVSSYATMAGLPFCPELSVLGGALARIYDDLVDDIDGPCLDDRLADLFQDKPFVASNDFERLLQELYHAIDRRLARPRSDPIYATLSALHGYQTLSRRQKDPAISGASLDKITRGKGGLANVALFALVRPDMSTFERELIMALGETLQLLDDYVDVGLDRRSGITTAVARGDRTLMDVSNQLRELRPRFFAFYGSAGARQFVGVLYVLLLAAFLKRRGQVVKARALPRRRRKVKRPIWILICGGDGVIPRADL